jgi:hypothetical protein
VRCPQCRETFDVLRESSAGPPEKEPLAVAPPPALAPPPAAAAPPAAPPPPAPLGPEATAVALLEALAERLGPRLDAARREGRVLSELGPELLSTWDQFRDQLGQGANAEVFRRVLRERWSVDLGLPHAHPGRGSSGVSA